MKKIKYLIGGFAIIMMSSFIQFQTLQAESVLDIQTSGVFLFSDEGYTIRTLAEVDAVMYYEGTAMPGPLELLKTENGLPIAAGQRDGATDPIRWTIYDSPGPYAGVAYVSGRAFPETIPSGIESISEPVPMIMFNKQSIQTDIVVASQQSASFSAGTLDCGGALTSEQCYLSYEIDDTSIATLDSSGNSLQAHRPGSAILQIYANVTTTTPAMKQEVATIPVRVSPPDGLPLIDIQYYAGMDIVQESYPRTKIGIIRLSDSSVPTTLVVDDTEHFEIVGTDLYMKSGHPLGTYNFTITCKYQDDSIADTTSGSIEVGRDPLFSFVINGKDENVFGLYTQTYDPEHNTFTLSSDKDPSGVSFRFEDPTMFRMEGDVVTILKKGSTRVLATYTNAIYSMNITIKGMKQEPLVVKQNLIYIEKGTKSLTLPITGGSGTGDYIFKIVEDTPNVRIEGDTLYFDEDLKEDLLVTVMREGDDMYEDSSSQHYIISYDDNSYDDDGDDDNPGEAPKPTPPSNDNTQTPNKDTVTSVQSSDKKALVKSAKGFAKGTEFKFQDVLSTQKDTLKSLVEGELLAAYDLTLTNGQSPVALQEEVSISLQVGSLEVSGKTWYLKTTDGKVKEIAATYKDGQLDFKTNQMGTLLLVENEKDSTIKTPTDETKTPTTQAPLSNTLGVKTGDNTMFMLLLFTGCITSFLLVCLYRSNKKTQN